MRIYRREVVAAVAVVLALSGCSAVAAEPTAEPTAEPVAGPAIAVLTVGGTGVAAIDENGQEVSSLDYTSDGATTVAYLTAVFGSEPVVTVRPSDQTCFAEASRATWGDDAVELLYDFVGEKTELPTGQYVQLTVKSSTVGDVVIATPTGFSVHESEADLIASVPGVGTHVNSAFPERTYVDFDVAGGVYTDSNDADFGQTDNEYWGAQAYSNGGTIAELWAPYTFQSAC
jgi:Zn-dependent alcohol dehydrogenase